MNGERTKHRRQQQRLIYCRGTPVNNARQAGHEGTGFGRHRTLQRPQDRSDLRRTNNESVSPVALDINSTRPNEKNAPKKKTGPKKQKTKQKKRSAQTSDALAIRTKSNHFLSHLFAPAPVRRARVQMEFLRPVPPP